MTVIGLGQAFRRQSKAAAATRRERTHLGADSPSDLAFDMALVDCAGCGAQVRRGGMIWSEAGEVCVDCHASVEVTPVGRTITEAQYPVLLSVPGVGFIYWTLLAFVGGAGLQGRSNVLWFEVGLVAWVCASVALMIAGRRVWTASSSRTQMPVSGPTLDFVGLVVSLTVWLGVVVGGLAPVLGG